MFFLGNLDPSLQEISLPFHDFPPSFYIKSLCVMKMYELFPGKKCDFVSVFGFNSVSVWTVWSKAKKEGLLLDVLMSCQGKYFGKGVSFVRMLYSNFGNWDYVKKKKTERPWYLNIDRARE